MGSDSRGGSTAPTRFGQRKSPPKISMFRNRQQRQDAPRAKFDPTFRLQARQPPPIVAAPCGVSEEDWALVRVELFETR
jgi:hypothetical protein